MNVRLLLCMCFSVYGGAMSFCFRRGLVIVLPLQYDGRPAWSQHGSVLAILSRSDLEPFVLSK